MCGYPTKRQSARAVALAVFLDARAHLCRCDVEIEKGLRFIIKWGRKKDTWLITRGVEYSQFSQITTLVREELVIKPW